MKSISVLVITLLWLSVNARATMNGTAAFSKEVMEYCSSNFPKPCSVNGYRDWYRVGSYCLKYFNLNLNFSEAEFSCRNKVKEGHLVSVHHNKDNTDLLCIIMKENHTHPRIWIGALELFQSNQFIWTDGSPWDFAKWVPGQPDNTKNVEDCVEMNWSNTGEWNDGECQLKKNFVCSFKFYKRG